MTHAYTARDLSYALEAWRRRLALQRGIIWALRGLVVGAGLAVVLLTIGRFVPWPGVMLWAFVSLAAGLVAGLAYGLAGRPSMMATARRADGLTGLADRLATAWELRAAEIPIACLQRENALESLKGRYPADVIPLWPGAKAFAPLTAVLVLAVLLAALPNPMDRVTQERQEFQEQLAQAKEQVAQAREDLTQVDSPLSAEERAALEEALAKLEDALDDAGNTPEALEALSEAESEIGALELNISGEETLTDIAGALSGSAAADLGQALASGNEAALREAMSALAEQIKDMSPEELQALTAALQQAANAAAGQDEAVAGALRDAARQLASGEVGQGDAALQDLQDALTALQSDAAAQDAIDQTLASLRNARSSISGVALAQAGQGSGGGQGEGNGSGEGNSSGSGEGNGSGQGNGGGSGFGTGNGSGTGIGQGGGTGGSGAGDQPGQQQGDETGRLASDGETVYITGTGPDLPTEIQTGSGTAAAPGALRPYREVVGEYADQAREHLERSPLPAGYEDLIRRYFSELED